MFGADIGETSVKLGLFYADGKLLEKREIPTRTANGGVHVLPDVAQAIAEVMGRNGISVSQSGEIGIGVPGPVDDSFTSKHICELAVAGDQMGKAVVMAVFSLFDHRDVWMSRSGLFFFWKSLLYSEGDTPLCFLKRRLKYSALS